MTIDVFKYPDTGKKRNTYDASPRATEEGRMQEQKREIEHNKFSSRCSEAAEQKMKQILSITIIYVCCYTTLELYTLKNISLLNK